jgi:hypothetical protein
MDRARLHEFNPGDVTLATVLYLVWRLNESYLYLYW